MLACVVALLETSAVAADFRQSALTAICYVVPYAVAGAFLISRRPDLPFGWLLAGTAVLSAAGSGAASLAYLAASHGTSTSRWLAFVAFATSSTQFLPVAVQGLINVRFPSGRLSSRWGRALEIALIAGTVLAFIGGVLQDQPLTVVRPGVAPERVLNPLTTGTGVGRIASGLIVLIPVVILLGLVAGLGVVRRAWKATGTERYQLRWRAYGVVLALLLFPLAVTETLPLLVGLLDGLFFVVTLAIPVVRYRLWAIDTVIRRSAAYALVTVAVAGLFAVIAAAGTALASQRTGFILAAAVAAVAFAPARSYSQRLVDRLFYGQRNDPYRALSELGRRLSGVAAPGEVLPALVTAVAESLHLPYVAVERPADGSVLAAAGQLITAAPARIERWPLSYHGAAVGVLVAQPRRGEQAFDPRDRAVLDDIARQAGAAVHAEALTADLLDSRQRLVSAREEERRRLRRDLHDGLGPLLTSIGLNIDAARTRAGRQPAGGQPAGGQPAGGQPADVGLLLGRAKDASTQAIADLRGIVYGLRPSSLDDLGLPGAVGAHIRRLSEGVDGRISLEADGLTELPAAVEVAAFRIAVEAVNNAVRHARAHRYQVRLAIDRPGQLLVEVCDDGAGREPWPPGVGLSAMRERATELGGTLTAGPGPSGGTVRAYLPLPAAVTLSAAENAPITETQSTEETP